MGGPHMGRPMTAFAQEVPYHDPVAACALLAHAPGTVLLDSALFDARHGRYSFVAVEPFLVLESKDDRVRLGGCWFEGDPFAVLEAELARHRLPADPDLPPFQGGAAGFFGYELARHLERVPGAAADPGLPDLVLGFYDVVVSYDHVQRRAWVVSTGRPEQDETARRRRGRARLRAFVRRLDDLVDLPPPPSPGTPPALRYDFTRPAYEAAVGRVIASILAGDIYQANLSQRFRARWVEPPFGLYRRLRQRSPAPFAAWLDFGDIAVASASPERFLRLDGRCVETRPVKGTCPRGATPEEDEARGAALLASGKDHAENVMIVDLLRNDLSRVCLDHTVRVPELCVLESFATVHHLVSTVVGELVPGATAVDLLRATFPGGSITGAPKIRAMEILAELEPVRRGPYCGSIGWLGFDGSMDTSIVIRTFTIRDGVVTFQAGGGVVADSDPAAEYDETLDKVCALAEALGHVDGWDACHSPALPAGGDGV